MNNTVYMYIRRSQIDDLVSPSGFNFENMMHKMVVELGCILWLKGLMSNGTYSDKKSARKERVSKG